MADVLLVADSPPERAPPKKRRRIVISCIECHRRKQKCDRELPCGNCKSRNKESHCTYEAGAPTAREHEASDGKSQSDKQSSERAEKSNEPLSSAATAWGYAQTGTSTMCFLQKIERASTNDDDNDDMPSYAQRKSRQESFAVKEKYKGLIRLLPAKTYLDQLIDMFFKEFNKQYYLVDPAVFRRLFEEWNNLPFKLLSTEGPQALSPELRVFPAMMFQMVATALLILPETSHPVFDALKYAGNMTFEDLAMDFSESGVSVVNLFGKKNLTLTTVRAHFLRAAFLKYTGGVTESWHTLSVAIKDAQELGMHRDSLDPKPASSEVEAILENQWDIEARRHIYMLLAVWDIHMCIILGRPGSMDWKHDLPSLPTDAPTPSDRSRTPVLPRDEERDPPTPVARNLLMFKMVSTLEEVHKLEGDGSYPKEFTKVDQLHEKMLRIQDSKPAYFRLQNTDKRWDEYPNMSWIKEARYFLEHMHYFCVLALHRPYVFHREKSRELALKSSLDMLEIQRLTFAGLPSKSWRNFHLFYGSFDAVTMIAAIYILFPYEHRELRDSAMQHFQWTVERFSAIQERNVLARSALGVLRAIVARVTKAISNCAPSTLSTTSTNGNATDSPRLTRGTMESTPGSAYSTANGEHGSASASGPTASTTTNGSREDTSPFTAEAVQTDFTISPEGTMSFAGIAPIFPLSDIIYNDLSVFGDSDLLQSLEQNPPIDPLGWQFGGDFGQDTVWQFLNQNPPGTHDSG
ncbi:hypothetical protein PT974_02493 [Cladobotryum mycophilum]|uniref:Zn(2)-C6 fungal-type domain-containing protein n=1 Tax=Cladobotryum mycophilum TaxID=491253 RepID=A0ABR0SZF0_9HYPO